MTAIVAVEDLTVDAADVGDEAGEGRVLLVGETDAGTLRICPNCKLFQFTFGFAAERVLKSIPSAAAIAYPVSPETTV